MLMLRKCVKRITWTMYEQNSIKPDYRVYVCVTCGVGVSNSLTVRVCVDINAAGFSVSGIHRKFNRDRQREHRQLAAIASISGSIRPTFEHSNFIARRKNLPGISFHALMHLRHKTRIYRVPGTRWTWIFRHKQCS